MRRKRLIRPTNSANSTNCESLVGLISVAHQAFAPRTLNELWFLCPKQKTNLKTCWKKQQLNRRTARPFSVLYWNPPSGVPGTAAQGEAVVEDSALDLQHWEKEDGTSVIPFFTSLEALQQAVEDEQAFVVMPVRTLFEMTLGETLFLNAKLPTGKEFMPREISLLIGEEGNPLSSQEILEGGESLILSEVAEPPAQMIDSLTTLFKTIKPVKRAFICSIKENEEAQPNLLIGIEADGDIEEIIQATGSVATDTLPGDEPIDICQVKKGEKGISHFITEHIAPFYERRWGGFLRDFKQNRII